MYMANASPSARGPSAIYIPPVRIGLALGLWGFQLGVRGFQLGPRGFSDTNMLVSAPVSLTLGGFSKRRTQREAVCIALQWNIGLNLPIGSQNTKIIKEGNVCIVYVTVGSCKPDC